MPLSGIRPRIVLGILALAAWGCAPTVPGPTGSIRVAAASDLQGVMPELVRGFEATSAQKVEVTPGASGKLAEQIRAGARFDLFLAANETFVKKLADEGRIKPASVRPYAIGSLVLAVRGDSKAGVKSLDDLSNPEVKAVALANPDVAPYGIAGRQTLKKAGLWDEVEPKLVLADSVRQAFQFVATGNADAGLVSRSLIDAKGEVKAIEVDQALHDPIVQTLGIVSPVVGEADSEGFVRFLTGPKGRAILEAHGFRLPPETPAEPSP